MKVDQKATYLAMINKLPGTELFQTLYVTNEQGQIIDVSENGRLSCALVVSRLLTIFQLIDRPHATVGSTIKAIEKMGWTKSDSPVVGGLVVWPPLDGHAHIGFCIGDGGCISNNADLGVPSIHQLTMKDGRKPEFFLTHSDFLG